MSKLGGSYAYSIQGFMHARSVDAPNNHLPATVLKPNQAGVILQPYRDPTTNTDVDPGRERPAVDLLHLPGFNISATLLPSGYYPFSETGFMAFGNDGTLYGSRLINTAGYPGDGSRFIGRFKYDDGGYPTDQMGFITTQRVDAPTDHVDVALQMDDFTPN